MFRKRLIIASTLAFALLGTAYAFLAPPVYLATAVIQIERSDQTTSALSEMELLQSRNVIGHAIQELGLEIEAAPRLVPLIGHKIFERFEPTPDQPLANSLFGLNTFAWGGESISVAELEVPRNYENVPLRLVYDGHSGYVLLDEDGGLLVSGMVGRPVNRSEFDLLIDEIVSRPGTEFVIRKRNLLTLIAELQDALEIKEKSPGSDIIQLRLESQAPEQARDILREVSRAYIELKRSYNEPATPLQPGQPFTRDANIPTAGGVLNAGGVRIIDPAEVDTSRPVWPQPIPVIALATLIGFFFGIAVAVLLRLHRRDIQRPEALERLGLEVFASVPFSARQQSLNRAGSAHRNRQSAPLLAAAHPEEMAIESCRSLRTSLHFAMVDAHSNIVMICGPGPGAGSSFVSSNLAAVIAGTGKRLVLVDGDMRKGRLNRIFGRRSMPGLSDVLNGLQFLDDVTYETSVKNLSFIPRGSVPPNPSELLTQPGFKTTIKELSQKFDVVLIDAPPILAVTDAALIGMQAGTSLIVARSGMNTVKEIELAVQRFAKSGVDIQGAVLNGVQRKTTKYGRDDELRYRYEYKSDDS
ncbi:polysaccharide biosynthesis tyrosine autokinase [Pseudomonas profundi]|uniref:polysaccharide biosynthesis tyrosine autokinase n=1 Tax=Pseudomonas profundi TaxID=1981513 RepID=UPI0016818B3B|nr:polysaccharide biosynthesis tyrosine autokinase [Pseudomonas profundi]